MKSLSLASIFGLALCAPVMAADLTAPVDTPDWTWQGAYAGAFGAGTLEHYKIHDPGAPSFTDSTHSVGSAALGGFAGYNLQSGNIVYGVEGELGYRFKKSTFNDVPGPGSLNVSTGLFGALKGRVGVDMGRYMPFVTAGVTAAQLKSSLIGDPDVDTTLVGGIVGAGVDVALTHDVFLRGEYDFSFFGKKTVAECPGSCQLDHTVQTHDFRVAVGLKF